MTLQFTDTHCHLDFDNFTPHLNQLLTQCKQLGVERIIVPSIGPKNWQRVIALGQLTSPVSLKIALGIHPWFLEEVTNESLDDLFKLATDHQHEIVAIGEAGIDGKVADEQNNLHRQIDVFNAQITLANKLEKPIIVHHRRSHQHIMQILKQLPCLHGGIVHAFSGSYQQAKTYIDLGFKLGIGGTITYERAKKTINTVRKLPVESLLLETDAPAMPIKGEQGLDNSPVKLINIFEKLCEIRSESAEELALKIEQNLDELFF